MTFYIDIDSGRLVSGIPAPREVGTLIFKQDESLRFAVYFVRAGQPVDLGSNPQLQFGVKQTGNASLLALADVSAWSRQTDGQSQAYYSASVAFNSSALASALGAADWIPAAAEFAFALTDGEVVHTRDAPVQLFRAILAPGVTVPLPGGGGLTALSDAPGAYGTSFIFSASAGQLKMLSAAGLALIDDGEGDLTLLPAPGSWRGLIETPAAKTYPVELCAPYSVSTSQVYLQLSGGGLHVDVHVRGLSATGGAGFDVSATPSRPAMHFGVNAGDKVELVVSAPSGAADFAYSIQYA